MTTLLTFRDNLKGYYSRYDYIATPILKLISAFIVLTVLNNQFAYMPVLNKSILILGLSCLCAFLPTAVWMAFGSILIIGQSFGVSADAAILSMAMILIFYCGYMRFVPKTGIIFLLMPVFYACHLMYGLPIVLAFLVGPSAIVPAIFGVILCYYVKYLSEFSNMLASATEDDTEIQGFQFIINHVLADKGMLLTIIVFSVVMLVTYAFYRSSFEHSWLISFLVGGFLNIVLFLIGSVTLSIEVDFFSILIGSLVGIVMATVIQFVKGVVDYQGTELLQFEDDEYYYYVKAIPKMSVAETNKNIKRINTKTF